MRLLYWDTERTPLMLCSDCGAKSSNGTTTTVHFINTKSNKTNWSMELSLISSSICVICYLHLQHRPSTIGHTYWVDMLAAAEQRQTEKRLYIVNSSFRWRVKLYGRWIEFVSVTHDVCAFDAWLWTVRRILLWMIKLPGNLGHDARQPERSNFVLGWLIWKRDMNKFDIVC